MKKTKFFVAVTLALVMCCSLSIPFASAAEMNAEDGWEYISAPLISEGEDGLEPQVHFGTNGNGVLHYNNLLRSAYALQRHGCTLRLRLEPDHKTKAIMEPRKVSRLIPCMQVLENIQPKPHIV